MNKLFRIFALVALFCFGSVAMAGIGLSEDGIGLSEDGIGLSED